MSPTFRRLRAEYPAAFLAALALGVVFAAVLVFDQMHWWRLKEDYLFGWLVPFFVGFVLVERWPRVRETLGARGASPLPRPVRRLCGLGFAGLLVVGGVFFLLGALYRAGFGVTQPGSLALAIGFAGLLPGMLYFNVPAGTVGPLPARGWWAAVQADARLRMVALFLFPALIWILSAPLVSAVENQLSLFLLRRIVGVVSTVFNLLGFPLIQEGNTLVLPGDDRVGVEEACSGIRSLTACLFTGTFLAAVQLDRWWKKALLVGAALALAVFTNLLRSLFLTGWAYGHGSRAIGGTFHDATGYAVLGLTFVGLLCLLPLFRGENWIRWLGGRAAKTPDGGADAPTG